MMKIKKEESITDNETKVMLGFLAFLVLVILVVIIPMVYLMSRPVSSSIECDGILDADGNFQVDSIGASNKTVSLIKEKIGYVDPWIYTSKVPEFTQAKLEHANIQIRCSGSVSGSTWFFNEVGKNGF